MTSVSIIGCGFVADLYMRSLAAFPDLVINVVYDRDAARLAAFSSYWNLDAQTDFAGFLAAVPKGSVVLNLTNPSAHSDVNRACLEAGYHVYSEKPLAVDMPDAVALHELAQSLDLMLVSAPCSVLGEAAQTLAKSVRDGVAGVVRLVYAELDDGFIPQAPYRGWASESGAPWPYGDEFRTGCTLEHAGYYLTWLIAMFGPVERVVAASAAVVPDKSIATDTPDFSVGVLFFENGVVARLTCSIVAPHDHQIRVIGDKGVLRVTKAWDNAAPVRFYRRFKVRRRLMESPIGKRMKVSGKVPAKVKRRGAASMNFALGPKEMVDSIRENRPCRLTSEFALHVNEVTLAIQNAGATDGVKRMETTCAPLVPMDWAV